MRLLNVHTLKLEDFIDDNAVPYAILSHRWEEEEVTFHDIQNLEAASSLKGFEKIQHACHQASLDGYQYAWIDTCCINKESSAELSEAINSMFRWYQNSQICYAYLSDVDSALGNFTSSTWFTRGWTLQELIAPPSVHFFDHLWRPLGDRSERKNDLISRTGVAALWGVPLTEFSVAHRMSWASNRITTRPEDMAYCLLGIFGVNMPLLYGEGSRAFVRLQEEIIKQVDDQTIFAWPMLTPEPCGLLASSPKVFQHCQQLSPVPSRTGRSAYSMTNRGLNMKLLAKPYTRNVYIVRLVCSANMLAGPRNKSDSWTFALIFLRRRYEDDQYARVSLEGESVLHEKGYKWHLDNVSTFEIDVNVRQMQAYNSIYERVVEERGDNLPVLSGFLIRRGPEITVQERDAQVHIMSSDLQFLKMTPRARTGVAGQITIQCGEGLSDVRVDVGHDLGFNPVCYVSWPKKGSEDRAEELIPYSMYQRDSWSVGLLNGMAKREVKEWREGSGIWLVKGDRIKGLDFKLFREGESAMALRVRITDEIHANEKAERKNSIEEKAIEFSVWRLRYEWTSPSTHREVAESLATVQNRET